MNPTPSSSQTDINARFLGNKKLAVTWGGEIIEKFLPKIDPKINFLSNLFYYYSLIKLYEVILGTPHSAFPAILINNVDIQNVINVLGKVYPWQPRHL